MTLIETLRGPRIAGMAVFDWAASLLAAVLVGAALGLQTPLAWAAWLVGWVALGVAVHWALGVPTQLGAYLGVNPPLRPVTHINRTVYEKM